MYNVQNKKNNNNYLNMFDDFNNFFENALSKEMKTNIEETNDGYNLSCEMPGVKKEDIKINFEDGTFTILVNKKENKEEKKNYIVKERCMTSLKRSFYLDDVEPSSIKAKLDNGILNVTMKKLEEKKNPKKIIEIE